MSWRKRMGGGVMVFFAFALAIQAQGQAEVKTQKVNEKKTTAPRAWNFFAHYQMRLKAIEKSVAELPPETTATVVLLGDSITEGFRIKLLAGMPVVNMGISGDQIAMERPDGGVLARVSLLERAKPAHIFLLIGINDFGSSKPLEKAKRQYEELVRAIRSTVPQAKLHVQAILPTRDRFAHLNTQVNAMNEFLRDFAQREGLDFIDLHRVMADEEGQLRKEWTGDGLHLLPPAYAAWQKVLEEKLRAAH
jgi:lysophospholipase L1-like esterase